MDEYKELIHVLVNIKSRKALTLETILRIALSCVVVYGREAVVYCPETFITLLLQEKQVTSISELDSFERRVLSALTPVEIAYTIDIDDIINIIDVLVENYAEILHCLMEESLAIRKLLVSNPSGPIVGNLNELVELSFDQRQAAIRSGREAGKNLDASLLFFRSACDEETKIEVCGLWLSEDQEVQLEQEDLIFDVTPYLNP